MRSLQFSKESIQLFSVTASLFFFSMGIVVPSWIRWIRIYRPNWIWIQLESWSETLLISMFLRIRSSNVQETKRKTLRSQVQKNLGSQTSRRYTFKQFYLFQIVDRTKNVWGMQCSIEQRAPGMWPLPFFSLINILYRGLSQSWNRPSAIKTRYKCPKYTMLYWYQCCGSTLVSMRICIRHFRSMRIRIRRSSLSNTAV